MNFLIKDVILNLSLITIIILTLTIFNQNRLDSTRIFQKASLTIVAILSILLCLLFPFEIHDRPIFSFLYIPIGLVGLYGGAAISSILFVVAVPLVIIFGGDRIEIISFLLAIQTLTNILLHRYFNKLKITKKTIIGTAIISTYSIVSIITIISLDPVNNMTWIIVLGIIFIQILFVAVSIFLIESFKKAQLRKESLMKADKMEGLYHLAASFGHEIRQPITICKGMLQLINEDTLTKSGKSEFLFIAISELDRAEKVIQDYQIFAEPFPKKKERFDVVSGIQSAINHVELLANERNIQIHSNYTSTWINGDKARIEQCIIHIVRNAFEAMESGGTLTIQTYSLKEKSIIEISDNGIGMTEKQITRLGEPYFSLNSPKGTGLGMMVVFRIVEEMQGKLEIQSRIGEGTKVTIVLPNEESVGEDQLVPKIAN